MLANVTPMPYIQHTPQKRGLLLMQTTQLPLDQEWRENMIGLVDFQDGNGVLTLPLEQTMADMEISMIECNANGWVRDPSPDSTWITEHGVHVWLNRSE